MAKKISKSARINQYLDEHPEAGYSEIQEALGKYGIKTYDIANVFTARRKKQQAASGEIAPKRKPGRPPKSSSPAVVSTSQGDNLSDVAVQFIQQAGSVDQAINILQVIRKVMSIKM